MTHQRRLIHSRFRLVPHARPESPNRKVRTVFQVLTVRNCDESKLKSNVEPTMEQDPTVKMNMKNFYEMTNNSVSDAIYLVENNNNLCC